MSIGGGMIGLLYKIVGITILVPRITTSLSCVSCKDRVEMTLYTYT